LERAYEVVHHDEGCPSIGGNGDADCKCDAVPFLRDLEGVFLDYRPSDDERRAIAELSVGLDLSPGAVIRQALKLYQLDYYRRRAGETCAWSGDEQRAREFAGLATPKDPHPCK
jgi:hypothetical protein